MNRRSFLSGSIALAAHHKLLLAQSALPADAKFSPNAKSPQDLLASTYPENFLAANLIPIADWHPYPRYSERTAWQSVPTDISAAIIDHAQKEMASGWPSLLATTFLEFKRNGNRTHYEAADFGRRTKLQHLVLAECIDGKGRFLDDITNGIWLLCEESFWGVPAHLGAQRAGVGLPDVTEPIIELFGAETVALLAWTNYLLGDQLNSVSPLITKRIRIESERRILAPERDRIDFVWMGLDGKGRHLNNWTPWICSNLLTANLLLEQDPKLRVQVVAKLIRSLDAYLNQYGPDAGCEEGPGYFGRAPMSYFECVNLIENATGSKTKIFANPFLDAMGRYILNTHICDGNYINYGDAHIKADPDGDLLYRYGNAVHDAQLSAFGAFCAAKEGISATGAGLNTALNANLTSIGRSLPSILQASQIRTAPREDVLIRDVWYPYLGLMAAREKNNSADGMYLAIQAANNGRSHSHNDSGSFIIYHDGNPVAIDVGVEAYTAKTFSADRYSIWTMQSAYHNLPTVGGIMQHDGAQYRATDLNYIATDQQASLSCNLATAYPKEAAINKWLRTVTLNRTQNTITVQENFNLLHPQPIMLSIMTPCIPDTSTSGIITMQSTTGAAAPVQLKYDATQLEPVVEKIPLADPGLRSNWGAAIYRILLKSKRPVPSGIWSYEFSGS